MARDQPARSRNPSSIPLPRPRSEPTDSNMVSSTKPSRYCTVCKKSGDHNWKRCPIRLARQTSAAAANVNINAVTEETETQSAALFVDVSIQGQKCQAMLDSGCSADSIVSIQFAQKHKLPIRKATTDVRLADKSVARIHALTDFTLALGDDEYDLEDVQVWESCISELILGLRFLEKHFVVDLVERRMFKRDTLVMYSKGKPSSIMRLHKKAIYETFASIHFEETGEFDIAPDLADHERQQMLDALEEFSDRFAS